MIKIFYSLFFILSITMLTDKINAQSKWTAPKDADELVNPMAKDEKAAKRAKKVFTQMCVICHGPKGKGDGVAGVSLNPRPANFTSDKVQGQSDGAIFWKITNGNAPMASYKDILSEDQRWELVNYIRSLK